MDSVRKVKLFKCESCGSSKVIRKDSDYFCDYCNSQFIYEKPLEIMPFFRMAIVGLVAVTAYIGYKYFDTSDTIKTTYTKPDKIKQIQASTSVNHMPIVAIKNLVPSVLSSKYKQKREAAFTPWLSQPEYQARFANGYYTRKQTYAAYVELDSFGNRRVLELPLNLQERKYAFYYTVKSGRDLKNIQKTHVNRSVNGKTLLYLSAKIISGTKLYCATWVSSWAYKDEVARLAEYGIFPPSLKNNMTQTSFVYGDDTLVQVSIKTSNQKDAGTDSYVYLTINENEKHLLDIKNYNDRERGQVDTYRFSSPFSIDDIYSFSLTLKGKDAWLIESMNIELLNQKKHSIKYKKKFNVWLSGELRDQKKLSAKRQYKFNIDSMERL